MACHATGSNTAIGIQTTTREYLAYGAAISTDLDLGDFLPEGSDAPLSLVVSEGAGSDAIAPTDQPFVLGTGHGRELQIHSDRELCLSEQEQPWCFEVGDVARFKWMGGSDRITFERLPKGTDHRLAFWLIHIFLPLYFTLEGRYEFIHASSVDIAEHTVLFTAPSHGGKSTLTDYFVQQGHALVSDDKVGTYREGEQYFAVPSHPGRRPFRKFEELGYRTEHFSPRRRKIHALYNLYAGDPAADVQIEEIRGHQGFTQVLPNYLFNFRFLQARRLQYLGAMLGAVPVFRVAVPWDLGRLSDVYRAICAHCGGAGSV
jgi:hypothetical protein